MKKALIVAGVVVGLLLLIVVSRGGAGDAVAVEIEELGPHPISRSIFASGKIDYEDEVSLTSEIVAVVNRVHVGEGDHVRKGQLVMELRDDEYIAAVERARALVRVREAAIERAKLEVGSLEIEVQRSKRLIAAQLVARDSHEKSVLRLQQAMVDLTSARASVAQTRAELEQAERQLGKTKLYSPMDGVVTTLDLKEGETAIPSVGGIAGSVLMRIADPTSLHARVNVDEADIDSVSVGDEAEIVAVSFRGKSIKGTLASVATSARVAEGRQGLSFEVKIKLKDHDDIKLHPGMSCRVEIETDTRSDVLAAPMQAVMVEEDAESERAKHYVYLFADGIAQKVAVETGISDDARYEIVSGVKAGQDVIVGPSKVLQQLNAGDAVSALASAPSPVELAAAAPAPATDAETAETVAQ